MVSFVCVVLVVGFLFLMLDVDLLLSDLPKDRKGISKNASSVVNSTSNYTSNNTSNNAAGDWEQRSQSLRNNQRGSNDTNEQQNDPKSNHDATEVTNNINSTTAANPNETTTPWYPNEMQRKWCTPPASLEHYPLESPRLVMPTDFVNDDSPCASLRDIESFRYNGDQNFTCQNWLSETLDRGQLNRRCKRKYHNRQVRNYWCRQRCSELLLRKGTCYGDKDDDPLILGTAIAKEVTVSTYGDYRHKNYSGIETEIEIDERFNSTNDSSTNQTFQKVDAPVIHKAAICRIMPEVKIYHFPHFMQHFLKCVDYWIDSGCCSNSKSCAPVLLHEDDEYIAELFQNAFGKGVLEFAKSSLGLVILPKDAYLGCTKIENNNNSFCSELYHPDQTIRRYKGGRRVFGGGDVGYLFQHAKEWNQRMDSYLDNNNNASSREETARDNDDTGVPLLEGTERTKNSAAACSVPPRIGILNRGGTRSILNADELAQALVHAAYRKETTNNHSTTTKIDFYPRLLPITVTYFEDKPFLEQVTYFREHDIIISGHGAQLTGLVFMPNDATEDESKSCKHLMELFPKGYGLPFFFGSLAVQSGIAHSYVYYDDGLVNSTYGEPPSFGVERAPLVVLKPWEKLTAETPPERLAARKAMFCPRSNDMVGYVSRILKEWYRCRGC